jgi:type VI secretion system secreted protein VgrG
VQYRPPRITPVPKVPGIMTGVIESAGGDYAHLDEEGRYRVRMHFDRGDAAVAEASHWIRMKQAYSGPEYGIHFPNHEGTEMVWACVDGDPDRPMALGTAPNPSQKSPVTSENKWQSVIRTWGRNELTFDDKVGEENIYMFATKDHTVKVTNNQRITVGANRTKRVGHDETNTIHNHRTTTIEEGNDTLTVTEGKRDVTVKKDQTFTIQEGDFIVDVQNGSGSMTFHQNRQVSVVTGNDDHNVKGTYKLKSEGAMNLESLSKITIESPAEIEIKVGASSIKLTPASIEIKSPIIISEADGINIMKAPLINSEASGINHIKGGMVTINP